MTSLHSMVMDLMPQTRKAITQIRRCDSDLAEEMSRCFTRVALDHAVGSATHGLARVSHFESALGAAARLQAAYDLAEGFGYLRGCEDVLSEPLHDITRALATMTAVARANTPIDVAVHSREVEAASEAKAGVAATVEHAIEDEPQSRC